MSNPNDPPLDEIQWRSPQILAHMGGLHSNTILFYFAESPFFERTSNNAVIMSQAMNNQSMYHYIQTREAFEIRLKTMSGLEFIVGEEPAETGPGMGTGVWVIRKQTRRKRYQDEDEITVHASFFVVGENIYMAPSFADILASRIMTISSAIEKALPAAGNARKWRPSMGHVYQLPAGQYSTQPKAQETKDQVPAAPNGASSKPTPTTKSDESSLEKAAEESFFIQMRYGGEYVDENPITGRPGEFHLSSTGRKAVLPQAPAAAATTTTTTAPPPPIGISAMSGPTLNTKLDENKKDAAKSEKSPKSATMAKPKKKKSKMSSSVTPAATPAAS